MDPKPKDPSSAGGDPDEFTFARKRSRRVSFAETTAVHVFSRDEDFETPPDSKPSGEGSKPGNEELGFQSECFDSDDSKCSAREEEEEDEDDDGEQERFIRDMDSSSPGSAAGSVTSNDDNFFGPVSTSFIKSGRLSEAGVSDDNNHDITLDSTAFSLHFQNVVPPDDLSANSAGSLRTPLTGDSVPTDSHGFIMVSKGFKEQVPRSKLSDGKMSGSTGDTSNMSLVVEKTDSYDHYGKMSPTLEALLAEANKSMQPNSPISGSHTRASQHDNHSPALKRSVNDGIHIGSKNATGMVDDACFDSNLLEGCSMGFGCDQSGNDIPSPNKVAGLPIDSLLNEKTPVSFSPKSNGYSKDVDGPIQSNAAAKDVQSTDMLSPPYRKSGDNLALQSGQVHQELFQDQVVSGNKHALDSSHHSVPILPALASVDGQQLFSEQGMQTPQNIVQPLHSPLPGSVSSLSSKRQQLFLDPSVLSKNRLMHTPDKEEPLSSLKMKLRQHGDRISAIKIPKSVIHKSPVIIDSRSALFEKVPMLNELEGTLEKNTDGYSAKYIGIFASNKRDSQINVSQEGRSAGNEKDGQFNISQEASGHTSGIQLNHSGSPIASSGSVLTNPGISELVVGNVKVTSLISSVQHSQPEENGKENLLTFENPIEQASMLDVRGSFAGQKTLKESSQILNIPRSISHIGMLGDKLSGFQGRSFSPRVNEITSLSSSLERNRLTSSESFTSDAPSKLRSPGVSDKNDSPFRKFQEQTEGSKNFQLGNQDQDAVLEKNLVYMKDKLSADGTVSSNEPSLEGVNKLHAAMNIPAEFLAEGATFQSPNYKKDDDNNMPHSISLKGSLPFKPVQDPIILDNALNCQDLQSALESHSGQTELHGNKRGIEQILLSDEDHISETSRIQKSPKILSDVGSNSGVFSGHNVQCGDETVGIGGQSAQKHCTDVWNPLSIILSKVCDAEKQLLSPSVCKLDSVELDILEDILGQQQTARKYERLYNSLRNHNCFGEQQKRVAEARSLLDKLVCEKAKLQLKRMKLDELSNKAQQCKLKIQECAKLKLIYSQFSVLDARTIHHLESLLHSHTHDSYTRDQAEYNRVTSMRHELEMLDQKVKRMMKAFETSCKIKGNMSCDGIINKVNDHIEMKNRCRLIQQDLQLWKLSDVVTKDDQCDIVLNYCNVLSQRFTIHSRSVSSIVSCIFLNNACIDKNFPNMNACIAFEFLFKGKGDRRVASSKQISQETLETNLLLGALLDVLEEVLVSRMQSWNLISSTFHLQRSGQLELQLAFLGFKSGQKITLSLDLTFLKCAAYPSKPSDLQIWFIEGETTVPPLISDEIMGAVKSLESGRMMIVRLCQSISKIMRDSDGS